MKSSTPLKLEKKCIWNACLQGFSDAMQMTPGNAGMCIARSKHQRPLNHVFPKTWPGHMYFSNLSHFQPLYLWTAHVSCGLVSPDFILVCQVLWKYQSHCQIRVMYFSHTRTSGRGSLQSMSKEESTSQRVKRGNWACYHSSGRSLFDKRDQTGLRMICPSQAVCHYDGYDFSCLGCCRILQWVLYSFILLHATSTVFSSTCDMFAWIVVCWGHGPRWPRLLQDGICRVERTVRKAKRPNILFFSWNYE